MVCDEAIAHGPFVSELILKSAAGVEVTLMIKTTEGQKEKA
jgi:hypothetical protein